MGDHVNPSAHDPLVTSAVWNAAQRRWPGRISRGTEGARLAGLARCAGCGGRLTPELPSERPREREGRSPGRRARMRLLPGPSGNTPRNSEPSLPKPGAGQMAAEVSRPAHTPGGVADPQAQTTPHDPHRYPREKPPGSRKHPGIAANPCSLMDVDELEVLTVAEVALLLRCSPSSVRQAVRCGPPGESYPGPRGRGARRAGIGSPTGRDRVR